MRTTSRRAFIAAAASIVAAVAVAPVAALAPRARRRPDHPDPRPGIDARNVTPRDRLPADVGPVFDRVREIPGVADGIRCGCGCAALEDMRSLLSCFEGHGMAQHCLVCQEQATLAFDLSRAGRSLDEIRAAVDERFP